MFPLKWNGSLWAQRGWCQSATKQWTHTQPLKVSLSLGSLPARWLLCCFTASARQINVFVHVFHPLISPPKEQFGVVMLFADWGGRSPAWVWARKHRMPEEGICSRWQQMGRGERRKGWLGSQRSASLWLLHCSHSGHTSFGIWYPVFASPAAETPHPLHTGQISEWVFMFLHVTFPAAVPHGAAIPALCPWQIGTATVLCRCFQQRQWKFGCCLQSEQEEAQLAASYGQSLRT